MNTIKQFTTKLTKGLLDVNFESHEEKDTGRRQRKIERKDSMREELH